MRNAGDRRYCLAPDFYRLKGYAAKKLVILNRELRRLIVGIHDLNQFLQW